jgi:hypothetical protein
MNFNKVSVAVIASLLIVNGAYAANKTGVTDSLNAGDSRVDLDYGYQGLSINGTVASSTTSFDYTAKSTGSRLNVTYLFGVTDHLNMSVLFGLSNSTGETSYTVAPNSYVITSKNEGASNPVISAQYLLVDKKNGKMGLVVFGSFSPASAASDQGVAQVETNGVVTTTGVSGKSGSGYATSNIGATLSTPVAMGDVFVKVEYSAYGEKSSSSGASKNGAQAALQFGLESKVSNSATVRPYVRVFSTASGYSGTTQIASHVDYSLGLEGIKDVSKSVSLSVTGEYGLVSKVESNAPNGDKGSFSGTGYLLGVRGMFFF